MDFTIEPHGTGAGSSTTFPATSFDPERTGTTLSRPGTGEDHRMDPAMLAASQQLPGDAQLGRCHRRSSLVPSSAQRFHLLPGPLPPHDLKESSRIPVWGFIEHFFVFFVFFFNFLNESMNKWICEWSIRFGLRIYGTTRWGLTFFTQPKKDFKCTASAANGTILSIGSTPPTRGTKDRLTTPSWGKPSVGGKRHNWKWWTRVTLYIAFRLRSEDVGYDVATRPRSLSNAGQDREDPLVTLN